MLYFRTMESSFFPFPSTNGCKISILSLEKSLVSVIGSTTLLLQIFDSFNLLLKLDNFSIPKGTKIFLIFIF